nr:MAG TPA: hypothetical protein [Caudoviricetes sp.]
MVNLYLYLVLSSLISTIRIQYISFTLYITTKIREIRLSHLSIISISLV